jgi:hypothetical protein
MSASKHSQVDVAQNDASRFALQDAAQAASTRRC